MLGAFGAITLLAASALAQPPAQDGFIAQPLEVGSPCNAGDMVGVWASNLLAPPAEAGGQPRVLSTDYIRILENGRVTYFASPRTMESREDIERSLNNVDQVAGLNIEAETPSPGVLILSRDGSPWEGFTCTTLSNSNDEGVTLWTQLQGRPAVFRHNSRLWR